MMKDNSPQVAQEADRLERALAAAGLDSESPLSYLYWNIFTNKGLRAALEGKKDWAVYNDVKAMTKTEMPAMQFMGGLC